MNDREDSGILSNPLSYLRNGYFYWVGASLFDRGDRGYYWSLRSADTTGSSSSYFNNTYLNPQVNYYNRGDGFVVRCDKSFTTLINTSYSMKNNGQTEENNRDSGVLSNPLSFIYSGDYYYRIATLDDRNSRGYFWSLRSINDNISGNLNFHSTYLDPQNSNYKGLGIAVRCRSEVLSLNLTILGICDIIKRYGFVNSSCWTRGTDRD